jgi:hypothetical protein
MIKMSDFEFPSKVPTRYRPSCAILNQNFSYSTEETEDYKLWGRLFRALHLVQPKIQESKTQA